MSLFPLITWKVKDSHIFWFFFFNFTKWGIFLLEVGVWLIPDGFSSFGIVTEASAVCNGLKEKTSALLGTLELSKIIL